MDTLYAYNGVYKANYRWLSQGLSIFSDLIGLGVTFGTMMIIIKRKMNHKERFNVIGTAISLSNRLNSTFKSVNSGLANIETQMRVSVVNCRIMQKVPLIYAVGNTEPSYNEPKPPANWPIDSSVRV